MVSRQPGFSRSPAKLAHAMTEAPTPLAERGSLFYAAATIDALAISRLLIASRASRMLDFRLRRVHHYFHTAIATFGPHWFLEPRRVADSPATAIYVNFILPLYFAY